MEAITGKKYEGKSSATKFKKPEEQTSGSSIVDDILGAFGGLAVLKSLGSFLVRVFAANPLVLGVASVGALFLLMSQMSKESHEEAAKVANAADVSGGSKEIMEASEDEIANKKVNILREAHRTGKIKGIDFSGEKAKKYLTEIGWDESTGTTQEERDAKALPEQKTETNVPPTPVASPETPKAEVKPEPITTAAAVPAEAPKSGQQLNAVQSENLDLSIPVASSDPSTTVNNNVKSSSSGGQKRTPIPLVRNVEETFQRMIFNSTRIV
jgi:outer membrane biosynthesis protein TonB